MKSFEEIQDEIDKLRLVKQRAFRNEIAKLVSVFDGITSDEQMTEIVAEIRRITSMVRTCDGCGTPFYRTDSRQRFCSRKCTNRVMAQRMRARK
jgi:CGNR zinc finger protein